jgi:hypothetical protein
MQVVTVSVLRGLEYISIERRTPTHSVSVTVAAAAVIVVVSTVVVRTVVAELVEVTVKVDVTVGIWRKEEQYGVAAGSLFNTARSKLMAPHSESSTSPRAFRPATGDETLNPTNAVKARSVIRILIARVDKKSSRMSC